ncbi:MAG: inositol monophosphatase [Actinomycetota bacterium]|nr:inositol monophosphatase [Actinomycetota bacterium]
MRDLLSLAVDTAHEAGALVARRRADAPVEVSATKSSPTDVVTASDTAAERLIRERLQAARPDDGFLGEEGGGTRGQSRVRWVVDPIDGTVNYLYGIPAYAVSIAAEVDGILAVGVVHNPVSDETWTALAGAGAWLDDRPVRVGARTDPAQALVATGFSYDVHTRAEQGRQVAWLLPRVRDIRRMGAASLDLCAVAGGRVDAYVEQGLKPWDLAAGSLVAREAGARVGGLGEDEAGERLVVAANPALWDRLQDLLREAGFGGRATVSGPGRGAD